MQIELEKLMEELTLLQEVMNVKIDVAISIGILGIGKESLLHWKKSIEIKKESLVKAK